MDVDPSTLPEPERGVLPDDAELDVDLGTVEPMTGVEPDPETAAKRAETWSPEGGEPKPAPSAQ